MRRIPPESEKAELPKSRSPNSTPGPEHRSANGRSGSTSRTEHPLACITPPPVPEPAGAASYRRSHIRNSRRVSEEDQHQHDAENQHRKERQEQTELLEFQVHEIRNDQ